jgi:hypothetical protein
VADRLTVTSAPKPPVSSRTASTGLTWLESTRSVAPSCGPAPACAVDVDGDDLAGPDQGGGVDGGVADPAAAEHGHGVAPLDLAVFTMAPNRP